MQQTNKPKTILLFGKTGAGKSTICNILSGQQNRFKESDGLESETKACDMQECQLFGESTYPRIRVVDTPGFMDSTGTDGGTLMAIHELLLQIKGDGFHIGLFCFSAGEMRCDGGIQQAMQLLTQLMTNNVLEHVYLVITQVNKLEGGYGEQQQQRIVDQVPQILGQSGFHLNYQKIFVYNHGKQDNGLTALVQLLETKQEAYIPQVCKDFVENYDPNSRERTMQNMAKNSETMQLVLQMISEMKESREQMIRQQQELANNMSKMFQASQADAQRMIQELREAQERERQELKEQKAREMEQMKEESRQRDALAERNSQMMTEMMRQQQAQHQQQIQSLQAQMSNRPKGKTCPIF